jgi:hypothetical protein
MYISINNLSGNANLGVAVYDGNAATHDKFSCTRFANSLDSSTFSCSVIFWMRSRNSKMDFSELAFSREATSRASLVVVKFK